MAAPKSEKITLSDEREITLTMLPLKSFADLMRALMGSFKEIAENWDGASNDEIIAQLPEFISEHLDEAAKIISVATRGEITEKDALEKYGLADAIDVISAAIVVNDVTRIGNSIKKAMAMFRSSKPAKAAENTTAKTPAQ